MDMQTIVLTADPAQDKLRRENRRLNKACTMFRRMAIAATVVVVFQTVFYMAALTRMDSVHKTIESASRTRIAAAQQEAAIYKSMLERCEETENRP